MHVPDCVLLTASQALLPLLSSQLLYLTLLCQQVSPQVLLYQQHRQRANKLSQHMEWNPNCWANLEGSYMLVNWGPCNKNWSITQIKQSPLGICFIGLDICCRIVQIQKSNGAFGLPSKAKKKKRKKSSSYKSTTEKLDINIMSICWMLHKYAVFLFSLGITFIFTVPSLTFYDILFSLLLCNFNCFLNKMHL